MTNPFDWRNQPPKIDWKALHRSGVSSQKSSETINDLRRKGIEPSKVGVLSSRPTRHEFNPKKFVVGKKK